MENSAVPIGAAAVNSAADDSVVAVAASTRRRAWDFGTNQNTISSAVSKHGEAKSGRNYGLTGESGWRLGARGKSSQHHSNQHQTNRLVHNQHFPNENRNYGRAGDQSVGSRNQHLESQRFSDRSKGVQTEWNRANKFDNGFEPRRDGFTPRNNEMGQCGLGGRNRGTASSFDRPNYAGHRYKNDGRFLAAVWATATMPVVITTMDFVAIVELTIFASTAVPKTLIAVVLAISRTAVIGATTTACSREFMISLINKLPKISRISNIKSISNTTGRLFRINYQTVVQHLPHFTRM